MEGIENRINLVGSSVVLNLETPGEVNLLIQALQREVESNESKYFERFYLPLIEKLSQLEKEQSNLFKNNNWIRPV